MAAKTTGPFSAIHNMVTQPDHDAVVLGEKVVDRRVELAVHLENPFQDLPKGGTVSNGFLKLRPMNKAIWSHNFVKNIQVSLIEYFLNIAAHGCLIGCSGHCFHLT
jgi:hypothetical protein